MKKKRNNPRAENGQDFLPASTADSTEAESCEEHIRYHPPGPKDRQDRYIIPALLLAAFAVRLYSLQFYHVIPVDGTTYALTAQAVAHGDWHGLGVSGFYPVLIAVAHWFISDLETAGRMASVVCGSLLVIPLYGLGQALFNRKTALAACLIAIVWPTFVSFSCEVVTQAAYTTLQLAAVYCIWQAFSKPTVMRGCLAGLLMGLSYFTRPEAILLSVTVPAALCLSCFPELREKRLFFWSYSGSFLLIFVLNMLLVHHISGEWQLSAKTDSALNDALSYYLDIPDMNYVPGYKPKGYLDIIRDHPEFLWKNTLTNLQRAWQTMLPLPLWLLFFAGFFSGGLVSQKNRSRLLLLATSAPLAVIIVFYYIDGGYTEAYLPMILLFSAAGFVDLENRLKNFLTPRMNSGAGRILQRAPLLLLAAGIYAGVVFVPQIRKNISDAEYRPEMDDGRRAEKHIGRLLKSNLPPGKIMTRWARIAFYAEREWVTIPAETDYESIIKTAKDNGAKYLIADGMLYSVRPNFGKELFAPFMDRDLPPGLLYFDASDTRVKGLIPVMIYTDPGSVGVIVYEIPPEKS